MKKGIISAKEETVIVVKIVKEIEDAVKEKHLRTFLQYWTRDGKMITEVPVTHFLDVNNSSA